MKGWPFLIAGSGLGIATGALVGSGQLVAALGLFIASVALNCQFFAILFEGE